MSERNRDDELGPDEEIPEEVELEIEDAIDLHTFAPRDVPAVVVAYVDAAYEKGFREVRLIHGKGTGFQRKRVREVLSEHPRVASFTDGTPERGAWGATIAVLREPSPETGPTAPPRSRPR